MALYKAVKLEIMILTETTMSDEEIIQWAQGAMLNYADFLSAVVKIKEKHEQVMANLEAEVIA